MKKNSKLSPDTQVLIFPVLMIIAFIILSFLLYKIGYTRLQSARRNLADEKKLEATMQERLSELQQKQNIVEQYSLVSVIVLPQDPGSLETITQLKSLAEQNGLTVGEINSNTTSSQEDQTGEVEVEIAFTGGLAQSYQFLLGIKELAPLMQVDSFEVSSTTGTSSTELNVKTFFADLPETLLEVDEPINKLTQEDLEILAEINNLRQPDFNVLEPTGDASRENPFTF